MAIIDSINIFSRKEFLKYLASGIIAVAADFSMLYVCVEYFGAHYLISNALGFMTGWVVSYWINVNWVFSYRRYHFHFEFTLFTLIVLIGLGLSELLMYLWVNWLGQNYLIAKVISSGLVFVYNYAAKKLLLFSCLDESWAPKTNSAGGAA